jgi:hypothetical protein
MRQDAPLSKKEKEEKIQLLFLERFFASYQNKNEA